MISEESFLTPEFFQDPYPFYRMLLEKAPVVWSHKVQGWLVSPFADVQTGLKESTTFGSGGRIGEAAKFLDPHVRQANQAALDCLDAMMSFRDAPHHTRLRRLVSRAFTARRVVEFEPEIERIVNDLVDGWPDSGEVDLVESLSFPLPAMVICRMLGIPESQLPNINSWADGIVNLLSAGNMTEAAAVRATKVVQEATAYLSDLIDEKRRNPSDDLMTALVSLERDQDALSRPELIALIIQLFFAGFETTEGLIGNALHALLRNRDLYASFVQDPSLAPLITEESLRFDNSIQRQTRIALRDVEVQGEVIKKGSYVFFLIGAANRDPRHFNEPDNFDPFRADLDNVSFGHGVHFCVGAPLARLETTIALRTLSQRFPRLHIAAAPTYGNLLAVRKPRSMRVHT